MDRHPAPPLEDRLADLRTRLGAARVDSMIEAAGNVGSANLPFEEAPIFGFLQRILLHLRNNDRPQGMLFPKTDAEYKRFYDYFDGEGRIVAIVPGEGPEDMTVDPTWVRHMPELPADQPFYEVVPGAGPLIVAAFLEAYAAMLARGAGT